jgi:hypothetical protein
MIFENEYIKVYLEKGVVMIENKSSGVIGRVSMDGPCVIFTCRDDMQLVNMMGNACVCCYKHETPKYED